MTPQIELNKRLYDACTADEVDYELIERLLKEGANPLGATDNSSYADNIYDEVFDYYAYDEITYKELRDNPNKIFYNNYGLEKMNGTLYRLTSLFLKHGMVISKPEKPYDGGWNINPLWSFSLAFNDEVIDILMLLLDNGLDVESAAECWRNFTDDYLFLYGEGNLTDKFSHDYFNSG